MSLQYIIGSSGSGKSYHAYRHIIEEASAHPETLYYVIVPEQFTMQTQKTLVEMSPGKGILNIDVLSFMRLAYRVLQETGGEGRVLLEDTGKSMVLRKMVQQNKDNLPYLGSQMKKPGCLDEVKSLISEFMQYDISKEELAEMLKKSQDKPLLNRKLSDVAVLYHDFLDYLKGHYITGEEILDALEKALPFSEKLADSVVLLDGFTGFTPIQIGVIRELLVVCRQVQVTVTMDAAADPFCPGKPHQLFYMSRKMIFALGGLTKDVDEPILVKPGKNSRFSQAPALAFLERHLFRYHRAAYEKEQDEIRLFSAPNPRKEMEEAARRIHRLVRTQGMKYGEIAVIAGNLEEYGQVSGAVFAEAGIPFFLDETHSVLMNPFVEYLRSALAMTTEGFTYESVFRYLRCGMSNLTRSETDRLENYVIALGIRGFSRWNQTWTRTYRGQPKEDILEINRIREKFVREIQNLAPAFSGGKKKVREYCGALYEFAVSGRIQQKLKKQELLFHESGDRAMEKEYAQIYGIVMELLDRMVEILGEEAVSRREFCQLLETGFSKAKVALIPPSQDQVLVGDMERTRLKDVKALFFVGVNEGNIPKNANSGGILTEMDREFFEDAGFPLAPGPKEQMNMQRFYLYLNLTKPSRLLCLSWCGANGKGEAVRPAYLIGSIRALFPSLCADQTLQEAHTWERAETPGTSLEDFRYGLSEEKYQKGNAYFAELYSWYLNSPDYAPLVKKLVQASKTRNPKDRIGKAVARVLYGKVSPYSATRLERFSACAFAHFLQYGLKLSERAEYEFKAMDLGNVTHRALEAFAGEVARENLKWTNLTDGKRCEIADRCLDAVAADYGNTILKSSARNEYMIERTRRLLHRTLWALQRQLSQGEFTPEDFELAFEGGRIDRVDVAREDDKIYVKVIDYKTGNTSFDLVSLYYGLQLQLVVYMDAALQNEQAKFPGKEIIPAGIFYYNVKDPMIREKMEADMESVDGQILKELKMNGLVQADPSVVEKLDRSLLSIPVSYNKDGSFRKTSAVASREQFGLLNRYVKKKIEEIRASILGGQAEAAPYEMGKKNACTYCAYAGACGFDRRIPGYDFHRLKVFEDEKIWEMMSRACGEPGEAAENVTENRGSAEETAGNEMTQNRGNPEKTA